MRWIVLSIDFEFNGTTEPKLNLVCCSIINTKTKTTHEWWLHKSPDQYKSLKKFILEHKDEYFLGFQCVAEARCFDTLGIDPVKFKWIDNYLEYRCLSNHNDELNYGNQLVDGKVKFTVKPPPKWERTEEDAATGFKPTFSLAEASYKLLKVIRDTKHKEQMRQLIISAPSDFTEQERKDIMAYCTADVFDLFPMFEKIVALYKQYDSSTNVPTLLKEMELRGKYAALTGVREARGYPIALEETKNFSAQVLSIMDECQREVNKLFPEIKPFKFDKKKERFTWNQKITKQWIKDNVPDAEKYWKKTKGKDLSLSLEAFTQFFDYKHTYPKDNFGAQMVRFLKLKQNLYGFVPSADKTKRNFWDSVGSDGRVRSYMNIFGSQSSRSQPPSTSYLLLKPAWMRSLLMPAPGKCITSIDYGSEEYFITGLFYRDAAMIGAYLSGDVYLAFAIQSGMAPQGATKASHKFERDLAKATTLGISYLMSKFGLARKLTADTGKPHDEDEAQDLIDSFYDTFEDFAQGQQDFIEQYQETGFYKAADGWYVWGDNDNFRSVANVPIQHLGAQIMREADIRCYESGLYVPCTLHDALYIEHDYGDWKAIDIAMKHMKEAFADAFPDQREVALNIRLDPYTWGPDCKENSHIVTPTGLRVDCSNRYIDERAESEYEQFKKYFNQREEQFL